jgi:hypothetical protein
MQLVTLEKFINSNRSKIVVIIIPSQMLSSCECIVYAITDIRVGMNIYLVG